MNADATAPATFADGRLLEIGVRLLTPETARLFAGTFSILHCVVTGEDVYRGVFAVRMFPIQHPSRFISLRYTDLEDKEREIGIIANMDDFAPETQELIRSSLVRQYHEKVVTRIHGVEYRHAVLFFEVETEDGRHTFTMWWSHDRAQDYGTGGKVLLDTFENRYIIRDVSALPAADQRCFQAYIYW